jgi:hypothetical protein
MGTNYYAYEQPDCTHCGRNEEGRHIGKSSGGWKFCFRSYEYDGLTTYKAWLDYLNGCPLIKDENGEQWSVKDLQTLIESKQGGRSHLYDRGKDYLDQDGYNFSTHEFS